MHFHVLEASDHSWDGHPEQPARVRATLELLTALKLLDSKVGVPQTSRTVVLA